MAEITDPKNTPDEEEDPKGLPPWPNFKETLPPDHIIPPNGVERAKRLVLAEGFSHYYCVRNCGNGRYVSGRTYPMRDDSKPNPTHFRKIQ